MKYQMRECPQCGKELLPHEDPCPNCGYSFKKVKLRILLYCLVGAVILCGIVARNREYISLSISKAQIAAQRRKTQDLSFEDTLRTYAFWLPQPIDLDPDSEDMQTARQKLLAFRQEHPSSRQGEMEFLISQDYMEEDAEAILTVYKTDYVLQAQAMANKFLQDETCSQENVSDYLTEAAFTKEEVHSAVYSLDTDWNQRALNRANYYMDRGLKYARSTLHYALVLDGFDRNNCTYAVEHCNGDWMQIVLHAVDDLLEENPDITESELVLELLEHDYTNSEIIYGIREEFEN